MKWAIGMIVLSLNKDNERKKRMDKFLLEKDGQIDFYNRFLMRVNPALSLEDILADNNDGVINGNLLEFKLHISDLNAVLFQSI